MRRLAVQSNLARWGNSLAVRLPAECVRAVGLREGETVDVAVLPSGEIRLSPERSFDKAAFLRRLADLHRRMPRSAPVVAAMRRKHRY